VLTGFKIEFAQTHFYKVAKGNQEPFFVIIYSTIVCVYLLTKIEKKFKYLNFKDFFLHYLQ